MKEIANSLKDRLVKLFRVKKIDSDHFNLIMNLIQIETSSVGKPINYTHPIPASYKPLNHMTSNETVPPENGAEL